MGRRQGRCGDKLVSVEDALQVIQPEQTVGIGVNANAPYDLGFYTPDGASRLTVRDIFITAPTRLATRAGSVDFLALNTARWPCDMVDGSRPLDVFLTSSQRPLMQPEEQDNPQNDGKIDIIKAIVLKKSPLHYPSPSTLCSLLSQESAFTRSLILNRKQV